MSTVNEWIHSIVSGLVGASAGVALLIWFLKTWIGKKIEASIEHEYAKKIADYENEIEARRRAQLIAELLAEWMSTPEDDPISAEQRKRLNKLSFEASLWLPEAIAADLSKVLQLGPDAPNQFELILRVREHLSGPHSLTPREITQWDRFSELPNRGLPKGATKGELRVANLREERNGEKKEITADDLKNGYNVPSNSVIDFKLTEQNRNAEVSIRGIEWIGLSKLITNDNETKEMHLKILPPRIADDINRNLFSNETPINDVKKEEIGDTKTSISITESGEEHPGE